MSIGSIAEIGVGVLFVVGATFNTVYTLRHHRQFYGEFADKAWLGPARSLINRVIVPNGAAFTVAVIVFQIAVAVAIFSRGSAVGPALIIGGCFAALVAAFSSPGGAVGNLALALVQFALAASG